ncbi:MAG: enoyl-CoA hydratase, partial [Candidatus Eremiobacteraeota bacterium]|nr:enoyl-CoA hydratase [Candidatus Eremiobacteraeota bacterium]
MNRDQSYARYAARHFRWEVEDRVATLTLDRPERKNPLTFASYAELRDTFRDLAYAPTVKA